MIRQAANQLSGPPVQGQTATVIATGYVLGWVPVGNLQTGQSYVAYFEENQHGFVSQVPLDNIQFQDGIPTTIPTFE